MRKRKPNQLYIEHGGGNLKALAKKQAMRDINESITHREPNETYCFIGRSSLVASISKYPEQIITI